MTRECDHEHIMKVGEQELYHWEAALLVTLGTISSLLCAVYLYLYFWKKTPWTRRHPGSLVAYRCIAEIIFALIFLFVPLYGQENLNETHNDFNHHWPHNQWPSYNTKKFGPNHKHGIYADDEERQFAFLQWKRRLNPRGDFLVFLVEWSLLSSELWFFCIGFDWYISMSNPFASLKAYRHYYRVLSFGLPLVMGLGTLHHEVSKGITFFFVPWITPACSEQMILRFDLRNSTLNWPYTQYLYKYNEDDEDDPLTKNTPTEPNHIGKGPMYQIRQGIHNDDDTAEFVRENALSGHWKPVKHWSYDDDNDEEHHVVERQWGSSWTYLYNDSSIDDDPAKKGCTEGKNKDKDHCNRYQLPLQYKCTTFFNQDLAWAFLWVFIVLIYVFNLIVLVYGWRRLRRGTQKSQHERYESLRRSAILTLSTIFYWVIPGAIAIALSTNQDYDPLSAFFINHCFNKHATWENENFDGKAGFHHIHNMAVALACMLALRGTWSVLTVFLIFRKEMLLSSEEQFRNMASENEALSPHLNVVLRTEVLQYSKKCIQYAIMRHELEDEPGDEESVISSALSPPPPEYSAVDQARQEFEYILPSADVEFLKDSPTYQKEMENQEVEMHPERLANRMTLRMDYDPTFLRGSQVIVPRASQTLRSSMVEAHRNMGNPIHENTIPDEPREPSKGRIQSLTQAISTTAPSEVLKAISLSDDSKVRFYDYNPQVFVEIRKMVGINPKDYHDSWESTTGANFSEGAGGAFFFFSKDRKYMAKTLTESAWYAEGEAETLMKMLMDYKEHLKSNGPASMLVRILGLHCMEIYGKKIYFMVQNNVFPPEAKMSMVYDLKGSWVNRQVGSRIGSVTVDEKWSHIKKGKTEKGSTLKDSDLNFVFLTSREVGMELGKQIDRDISFLRDHQIMDYSLLVGVRNAHYEKGGEFDFSRDDKTGRIKAQYVKGPDEYYFGLIDILQEWNWPKWIERKTKTILLCKDKKGVSAIEPDDYKDRFMARVVYAKIKGANPSLPAEDDSDDESAEMETSRTTSADASSASENGFAADDTDTSYGSGKYKRQSVLMLPRPSSGSWSDPEKTLSPASHNTDLQDADA